MKVNGKRILVVEDEALLALDLRFALEDRGASVVGPCYRLSTALTTAQLGGIDAAVLDVDLAGETVFPVADLLKQANIPFVFHTGRHNPQVLSEAYRDIPICPKPTNPETVADTLFALIERQQMH